MSVVRDNDGNEELLDGVVSGPEFGEFVVSTAGDGSEVSVVRGIDDH